MKYIIEAASPADIDCLAALVNSAYRGEYSKKGWTTEADLLPGELRTDAASLANLLQKPGSTILKCTGENGKLAGTVYLDLQDRGCYLGMLTVDPLLQNEGIGRLLLAAAEEHARFHQRKNVFMNVIDLRTELIAWYNRRGYIATGEIKPFTPDLRFGEPVQPLQFVVLEKNLEI